MFSLFLQPENRKHRMEPNQKRPNECIINLPYRKTKQPAVFTCLYLTPCRFWSFVKSIQPNLFFFRYIDLSRFLSNRRRVSPSSPQPYDAINATAATFNGKKTQETRIAVDAGHYKSTATTRHNSAAYVDLKVRIYE